VAFGVSCALAELNDELPQEAEYRAVPLCTGDPDELFARLAALPGEKVAKVKVGLYEAVRDGMVVNLLLEAIPDLQLRLDANRAWTPLKAQQFAKYVHPQYRDRIAFLEEPCKTRDDSRAFARETGIAIAWDESLREADFRFQAEPGLRALVIKPTLTGSLRKVREQVATAHALGLTAVISSSIESSLGLTQLARIAAWLTPQTLPGLDTLALMRAQLVRPGLTARYPA
jgi:O-succinylbenzoate synthase